MEDKRAKFLRVYANVPQGLRSDILVLIDKKPYTWNAAYLEVKDNSEIGKKILKTLTDIELL